MRLRLGARAPPHHALVAFSFVSVSVLVVAALLPPNGLPIPACVLRSWTGIPCFACGATRTFVHHAHGRFVEGLLLSPGASLLALAAVVVPLVAVARMTIVKRRIHLDVTPADVVRWRIAAVVGLAAHWTWLVLHGV